MSLDASQSQRHVGATGLLSARLPGNELEQGAWIYESPRFGALDFDFCVRAADRAFREYAAQVFEPFARQGHITHRFSVVDGDPRAGSYALYLDSQLLGSNADPTVVFACLLSRVTEGVVETAVDCLLLHSAGVEAGGEAFVFPGPSGAGKTTLAAALVRSGFGYVSDEVVAVDLNTLNIRPYPKALSIDKGSWGVLSDLEPSLGPELAMYAGPQWQVPAKAISPGVIAGLCVPCYLVALCYRPGPSSELVPLPRAEAVAVLAGNSFNFTQLGKRGLEALAEIAHRSSCYRLFVGD